MLKPYGISFETTGWEDAFPSAGRPHDIINPFVKTCDIFVCIFHAKPLFIVTSRYAGYLGKSRLEGNMIELSIQDFTPDEVKEFLVKNIRDRSGLFMGYSETEYGFTHLSFQEYLSAEQIRNKGQIDTLIQNYTNRWWKEAILLCLALDNPSVIEEFIRKLIPTEHFKSEIGLVVDAIHDSIRKPSAPCISAIGMLPYLLRRGTMRYVLHKKSAVIRWCRY